MKSASDVINLSDEVDKFKIALITEAMEKNGYSKTKAARALKLNRTPLIGLIQRLIRPEVIKEWDERFLIERFKR